MSAVYRSRFSEFSLAQATLCSYITTNRHVLLGQNAEGARNTVRKLLNESEESLRGVVNRNLPKAFIEAHVLVRKEWKVLSTHVRTSLDAADYKKHISTKDPGLHDEVMEVCRAAHRALNKLATTKSSFPGENAINQEFISAMNTAYNAAFHPSCIGAIKAPIQDLSSKLISTAPVSEKGPLSRCSASNQDLYDALLLHSEREEMVGLAKTFCKMNSRVVSELEGALSKVPEGELKEFSEAVFCRSRLIMLCLIESAKSKTDTFKGMLDGSSLENFVKLSEKLESVEAPIPLFLEDELDEDCVMLLFQIFQNVTFLTPEYKFDNPNVEDSIKETNIFSAYIQFVLKEKYFPKQDKVNELVKAIKDELRKRKKKDYEQVYKAILELFMEGEYEKGIEALLQLCKKLKSSADLFDVMKIFEESGRYHLIQGLLCEVKSLPYDVDLVDGFFRAALFVKDFNLAAHIVTLTKKSPKTRAAFVSRIPGHTNICGDANEWILLAGKLMQKKESELACSVMKQIVLIATYSGVQKLLLEEASIIFGIERAKELIEELKMSLGDTEQHRALKVVLVAQYADLTNFRS